MYSLPRKHFIALVSSLLGGASKCGSRRFSENTVRPLNVLRGRNQRVLREVKHSYLIDEVLCKFYCSPTRGVPEHERNLSRNGSEPTTGARVTAVLSIGYRCAWFCSRHRGIEWKLIDYANCRQQRDREKEKEKRQRVAKRKRRRSRRVEGEMLQQDLTRVREFLSFNI